MVAGNGTLAAAKELGWSDIYALKTDLEPELAKAFALADNQSGALAEWDDEILNIQLAELDLAGFDIESIGFDPIDGMKEPLTDDDAVPEVKETNVKRGDIYHAGEHRIMCGDSTDSSDVAKLMNGEKADMVFTDPPYGMNLDTDYSKMPRGGATYKKVEGDDKDFDPSIIFELVPAERYCIWGADWFYSRMPEGFSPIVWDKQPHHIEAGPQNHFELCWVRPKEKRRIIRKLWTGFTAKEKGEMRVHPTQKPIDLCIDLLERGGNLVADLFLGSGSTLIACEKTNRKCYGMEIDPHYCQVIIDRWQNYTGKIATLIKDNSNENC